MAAVELYVELVKRVLANDASSSEQDAWSELQRLRFYLSCRACNKILRNPVTPRDSKCQHTVCKSCLGQKMLLKPACGWCKDMDSFVGNAQLESLVLCYAKFCDYVLSYGVKERRDAAGAPPLPLLLPRVPELVVLLEEGRSYLQAPPCSSSSSVGIDVGDCTVPAGSPTAPAASLSPPPPAPPASVVSLGAVRDTNAENVVVADQADSHPLTKIISAATASAAAAAITPRSPAIEDSAHSHLAPSHSALSAPPAARLTHHLPLVAGAAAVESRAAAAATAAALGSVLSATASQCDPARSNGDARPAACTPAATRVPQLPPSQAVQQQQVAAQQQQPPAPVTVPAKLAAAAVHSQAATASIHAADHAGSSLHVPATQHSIARVVHAASVSTAKKLRRTSSTSKSEKRGCGCGTATSNPGSLTCYGQRCPCYSSKRPCIDCRCRGCRNPNKLVRISHSSPESDNDVEVHVV